MVVEVIKVSEDKSQIIFQKVLDRIAGPTLKRVSRAIIELRTVKEDINANELDT